MDVALDHGHFASSFIFELLDSSYRAAGSASTHSLVPVLPVTDCRSLYDAVSKMTSSLQEKRVQLDICSIREATRSMRWVPTGAMLADGLTKRCSKLRQTLTEWLRSPYVVLTESASNEPASSQS
jgi:hypothetical protein